MTRKDLDLHSAVAGRYEQLCDRAGRDPGPRISRLMDFESISDVVDWDALLAASDGDFVHDVSGIHAHMDRSCYPGKLSDCFVPRYARTDL